MITRVGTEITEGVFAHSSLVHGNRYSGRMSLVLEACRILSCKADRTSSCACGSCRSFRFMEMSNVVIVSSRDHQIVFDAARTLYDRTKDPDILTNLIKLIRIMLLQFHGALLESVSQKKQETFDAAASVNELLYQIEREESPSLDNLFETLKPVMSTVKRSGALSVAQVRALQDWSNTGSLDGSIKFIVLEGVEHSSDAARNSLLKFLEEPPDDTYLFVISERPALLGETILSRLRRYYIPDRNPDILQNESIKHYIFELAGIDCADIEKRASAFIIEAASGQHPIHDLIDTMDEPNRYDYFLDMIANHIEKLCMEKRFSPSVSKILLQAATTAAWQCRIFNQNRRLSLESLYYRMKEVFRS